ncbi:hypothetical protein CS542_09010 [Pedobacter sp. IW39]|nr:hypothetical protein CS542_09010 [Pedobacter sp. IW39]
MKSIITGKGRLSYLCYEMMNAIHKESLRIEDEIKLNFHGENNVNITSSGIQKVLCNYNENKRS